jgi:uncharacterized membrane protein (DUF373 family)
MSEHAPQQAMGKEPGFSPTVLKTLEMLDNLAHVVVAALFIIMAVTVLVHTCFILAQQVPLITRVPHVIEVAHPTEQGADAPATPSEPPPPVSATAAKPAGNKSHETNTNLEDPFYRVSLDLLSSILFAVIILELLRTIITYLQTHDIQAIMQEFLVVGIISSVRKILLVGAEASLSGSSGIDFIQEATGVVLNILGILLLIVGLFLLRRGDTKKEG